MTSTDILFVHANSSKIIYQDLHNERTAIEPPIWAGILATALRKTGVEVQILDCEVSRLTLEESVARIKDLKPRILCVPVYGQQPSASSQNMDGAVKLLDSYRDSGGDAFTLMIGGHVSALPFEVINRHSCVDAVAVNEGYFTLVDLTRVSNFRDESLNLVRGLVYRDGGGFAKPAGVKPEIVARGQMSELLPPVDWSLLPPLREYRTAGWHSWSNNGEKQPFASIYTSLGCPYKCSFCMINIINREDYTPNTTSENTNGWRPWPVESIIKQFEYFADQGVKNVKIADELFVLNPNHFLKICDGIIDLKFDFNIWAYARVDTAKPKYLDVMRRAGIKWLGLGIENPDRTLRAKIHKDGFDDVNIVDVIHNIRGAGINVGGNYIFGLPDDDLNSLNSTLQFALDNKTEMVNFYSAMAYPGSPLYKHASTMGWPLPKTYSGYSQHSFDTLNLPSNTLTSAEILKFRDYAWDRYNKDEDYHALLRRAFGEHAVNDIVDTAKISLVRKLYN